MTKARGEGVKRRCWCCPPPLCRLSCRLSSFLHRTCLGSCAAAPHHHLCCTGARSHRGCPQLPPPTPPPPALHRHSQPPRPALLSLSPHNTLPRLPLSLRPTCGTRGPTCQDRPQPSAGLHGRRNHPTTPPPPRASTLPCACGRGPPHVLPFLHFLPHFPPKIGAVQAPLAHVAGAPSAGRCRPPRPRSPPPGPIKSIPGAPSPIFPKFPSSPRPLPPAISSRAPPLLPPSPRLTACAISFAVPRRTPASTRFPSTAIGTTSPPCNLSPPLAAELRPPLLATLATAKPRHRHCRLHLSKPSTGHLLVPPIHHRAALPTTNQSYRRHFRLRTRRAASSVRPVLCRRPPRYRSRRPWLGNPSVFASRRRTHLPVPPESVVSEVRCREEKSSEDQSEEARQVTHSP
nr:formin-like protein 20 [Oryza sativa Japonica Group]